MIVRFLKIFGLLALIIVSLPVLLVGTGDAIGWYRYRTFASHLEIGMTRQALDTLIKSTDGSDFGVDDWGSDTTGVHVWYYYNYVPRCWAGGKMFTLHFKSGQLQNWNSSDSGYGC